MLNAGSDALKTPSDTVMIMPEVTPISDALGIPDKAPELALNVAQLGLFVIEKIKASSSISDTLGVKL
ncbi:hypothetical protein AN214_04409 [Pseudoalteromonas sp. P1-9]|nr:hypothetical protein AN214_04409 [Pseudoalteromonas sp. P1-9]